MNPLSAGSEHRSAYLGVDVGTQGVRAVLLDPAGVLLGSGAAALPASRRDGARHEQQAGDWWVAVVTSIRTALHSAGSAVAVEAMAVDATSGTVLVEHRDGTAAGPALMYDDARATEQADRAAAVGAAYWAEMGYRIQASWALPKSLWLLENGAVADGDHIVHQSDHLVRRLTGSAVATDTSHALKTGADLRDASWPQALFDELGLSAGILPDLVWSGTIIGIVGPDAARATGLRVGTPIRAGMTDGCAAQIAAGALAPGSWSSALGTTLTIKGSTSSPVHDPGGSVYSHRHPDGGWLPGGASSTGAGAITTALPDVDGDGLARLTEGIEQLDPPTQVTYPLVSQGERFPFVAREARGFLAPEASDPQQRLSALCHGIAYVERLAYDVLGWLGADVSGTVWLTGGTTRNHWWNQLRCDLLGRPANVPQSAQAAGGMAILAAAAPGELTETARRMVRVGERYQPDPERAARLRPGYERLVEDLVGRGWLEADRAEAARSTIGANTGPSSGTARPTRSDLTEATGPSIAEMREPT